MRFLLRTLITSLCGLVLLLVPASGEEGVAGEGGVINLPMRAAVYAQRSVTLSILPERAPILSVTQSLAQPVKLQLPSEMVPAVVRVAEPDGGELVLPLPTGSFAVSSATMRQLSTLGVNRLDLQFLSSGGLWMATRLDFDLQKGTVTLTVL